MTAITLQDLERLLKLLDDEIEGRRQDGVGDPDGKREAVSEAYPLPAYRPEDQDWYRTVPELGDLPEAEAQELVPRVEVLLVTVTSTERDAVLAMLEPLDGSSVGQVSIGPNTYYVGSFGRYGTAVVQCEMGSMRSGSATFAVPDAVHLWSPRAVVMVGLAFGLHPEKHTIGDVLVSEYVVPYEMQRLGEEAVDRGSRPSSNTTLRDRFRNADVDWKFTRPGGSVCKVVVGEVLTGEKLVDNQDFRDELVVRYPNAIGGEMEAAGLAAAMGRLESTAWIVVKAICDWGVGKHKKHQPLAAAVSASLVHHVLSKPTALHGLPEPPTARAHAAGGKAAEARAASATATDLDEAKAALLRTAEVAVPGFVAGSEEQEVSLQLENDRERRAAEALAAEGKAKLVGDVVTITVWRS